jgi:hypothetical protein
MTRTLFVPTVALHKNTDVTSLPLFQTFTSFSWTRKFAILPTTLLGTNGKPVRVWFKHYYYGLLEDPFSATVPFYYSAKVSEHDFTMLALRGFC